MSKFIITRENGIEVETYERKLGTTYVGNDLEASRFEHFFKVIGIFGNKEEAKECFEKEKITCSTSAKRKNRTTYITFDMVCMCEVEDGYENEYGEICIGDEYYGDGDFYIAPFKSKDDLVEIWEV